MRSTTRTTETEINTSGRQTEGRWWGRGRGRVRAGYRADEKTKEVWERKGDYLAYRKYQEEEMDLQYINVAH